MKVRKNVLVALAGWAGLTALATAQVPPVPALVPPPPAPIGITPQPQVPTGPTVWSKLGISKEQKEFCKRQLCRMPLGQFLNQARLPITALSGGLIPPFCPQTPSQQQLDDPGAIGAASKIMLDEAGAKERRAAVRYLGTVDCHYWPEAEEALIGSLRGDRNECVRWEAAMALGNGCCCTKKTIEALVIVVSCSNRDGFPKETSWRVHAAASAALDHCLCCYAHVSTAPVQQQQQQGEKPVPPSGEKIPAPTTPPATTPPVAKPPATTASVKSDGPGELKMAPSMNPPVAKAPRPTGMAYYAAISRAPLAAILTEARRVSESYHNAPIVSETPFPAQGKSVATLMDYAVGPNSDAVTVVQANAVGPNGELRADVVSAKPANLWDILSKPEGENGIVTANTTVVVKEHMPATKRRTEPVVLRNEQPKRLTLTHDAQPMPKGEPTPKFEAPAKIVPVNSPAPMIMSEPQPKFETAPLDFPPPAPMPMPTISSGPQTTPYNQKPLPTIVSAPVSETAAAAASSHAKMSPYNTTSTTGPVGKASSVASTAGSSISPYNSTATTGPTSMGMPVSAHVEAAASMSPYNTTASTGPTTIAKKSASTGNADSSMSPYNAKNTTGMKTVSRAMPNAKSASPDSSPYYATTSTGPAVVSNPAKTAPGVSPYHATAAAKISTMPVAPTLAAAPIKTSPAPVAAPAPLPAPVMQPVAAQSPVSQAPAAPMPEVQPIAAPAPNGNDEVIKHLLATASGNGPVEVRKASIQGLVQARANTPEVMAALTKLCDDEIATIRAEAVIAQARLKLGR